MKSAIRHGVSLFLWVIFTGTYAAALCQAQSYPYNWRGSNEYSIAAQVSTTSPAGPGSAASKVQVDAHGKFGLSIPLMEVPGGSGLGFPIKLEYSPGIRVTQEASWVGLGWSLDAGRIKRNVVGGVDGEVNVTQIGDWPDQYLVSMPGGGGKILRFPTSGQFALEESKPWKITYDTVRNRWIVITEDGTTYVYGKALVGGTGNLYPNPNPSGIRCLVYPGQVGADPYMEWALTAILSPDYVDAGGTGGDLYDPLDYNSAQNKGKWVAVLYSFDGTKKSRKFLYTKRQVDAPWNRYQQNFSFDNISLEEVTYPQYIVTPTFIAKFTTDPEPHNPISELLDDICQGVPLTINTRHPHDTLVLGFMDEYHQDADDSTGQVKRRLNNVQLFRHSINFNGGTVPSNLGSPIEEIDFSYRADSDYQTSAYVEKRTMLKSVQRKIGQKSEPAYEFSYFDVNHNWMKHHTYLDGYDSYWRGVYAFPRESSVGLWGWLNRNPNLITSDPWPITLANFGASDSDAGAWSLKSITYPLGSKLSFEYEANTFWVDFLYGSQPSYQRHTFVGGGPRLKSQTLDNATYTYSYATADSLPGSLQPGIGRLYADPIELFAAFNTAGSRQFDGSTPTDYWFSQTDHPILYSQVTEHGVGDIIYRYAVAPYKQCLGPYPTTSSALYGKSLANRGTLTAIAYRNYNGVSMAELDSTNLYESSVAIYGNGTSPTFIAIAADSIRNRTYLYDQTGSQRTLSRDVTTFYDDDHKRLPSKVREIGSDGTSRIRLFSYAWSTYSGMNSLNMLSEPYSVTVLKNGNDVESKLWTTWALQQSRWLPYETWSWKGDGSANDQDAPDNPSGGEVIQQACNTAFDQFGNPIRARDARGIIHSYVYGYSGSRLIAEAANTGGYDFLAYDFNDGWVTNGASFFYTAGSWSTVGGALTSTSTATAMLPSAYTSFVLDLSVKIDSAASTGWAGAHFGSSSTDMISTGYRVLLQANGELDLCSCSSTVASAVTSSSADKWHRISVSVNGNNILVTYDGKQLINYLAGASVPGGNVSLCTYQAKSEFERVRICGLGSLMHSYEYDPVTLLPVGETETNGIKRSYAYDEFNRLLRVIDDSNRIMSQYSYYFSREHHSDQYSSIDPNYVQNASFPQGMSLNGLAGYWRFEGDFNDAMGKGAGTASSVTFAKGYEGMAASFAGLQCVTVVDSGLSSLDISGQALTVAAWIYPTSMQSAMTILSKEGCFQLQISGGVFQGSIGSGNSLSFGTVPLNQWTYVAATFDGANVRGYINGVCTGTYAQPGTLVTNNQDFRIGARGGDSNPNSFFVGKLDEVKVYGRVLSPQEISSAAQALLTTSFVDDVGQELQRHRLTGSTAIVSARELDGLHRPVIAYKPYPLDMWSVEDPYHFDQDPLNSCLDYGDYYYDIWPASNTSYSNDPLGRIVFQTLPGLPGTSNEYWTDPTRSLIRNRAIDGDSTAVDSYVDMLGRPVESIVDPAGLGLDTKFSYDLLDNVIMSTPPKGSAYSTSYTYDPLKRLISKTSPDAGTTRYLYDQAGNVRLVKDANHTGAASNNWSMYRAMWSSGTDTYANSLNMPGKVTCSLGSYTDYSTDYISLTVKAPNGTVLKTFQVNTPNSGNVSIYLPQGGPYTFSFTASGTGEFDYSLNCTTGNEFIYTKYDSFNRTTEIGELESNSVSNFTPTNAESATFPTTGTILDRTMAYDVTSSDPLAIGQRNLKGRLSWANSYRQGSLAASTIYSYDDYGRVEWLIQKDPGGRYWQIKYEYDLFNNVTKKSYCEVNSSNNLYTFYSYDPFGRLVKVATSQDQAGANQITESQSTYKPSGSIEQQTLGAAPAKVLDYAYTEALFLKEIVDHNNPSGWRIALGYDYVGESGSSGGARAQWNGNISWMSYTMPGVFFGTGANSTEKVGWAYGYDKANRLTSAKFNSYSPQTQSWSPASAYSVTHYHYDANGNIDTLLRNGSAGSAMDNFAYCYIPSTNKLDSIRDAVPSSAYVGDMDSQPQGNYKYDPNGNVTQDYSRDIGFVTYDIHNLPLSMYRKSTGAQYQYSYDVNGQRVRKDALATEYYVLGADGRTEAINSNDQTVTKYNVFGRDQLGQIQRQNSTLARYYYLKDHLGTVRATISEGMIRSGLVAYWQLDGNASDQMNTRTGTVVGASTVAGKKGNALSFNGTTGNYCYDSLITSYQVAHPTVMGWIRRTGTGTILCGSVSGAWSDARGFCLNITSGGNLQFYIGDASGSWKTVTGSTVLQVNTWYHVAGGYDGSVLRVYVNGSQDGLASIGSVNIAYTRKSNYGPNPSAMYIGIAHNANNTSWTNTPDLAYPFNGTIDDLKLYNRALSQTEIQSDYQPSTLLAYDDYDPFGMILDGRSYNGGMSDTRYKFSTKERDVETGYDYFGARYFDARIGRWLGVDPMTSNRSSLSPYNYCSNSPLDRLDPRGMLDEQYQFSADSGAFVRVVDDGKKEKTGALIDKKGKVAKTFEFNDPEADANAIDEAVKRGETPQVHFSFENDIDKYMALMGSTAPTKGSLETRLAYLGAVSLVGQSMDAVARWLPSRKHSTFYLAGGIAYNPQDAGNFLWGMGVRNLGFTYLVARVGSEVNAFFNAKRQNPFDSWGITWEGDHWSDQKAIKSGYYFQRR